MSISWNVDLLQKPNGKISHSFSFEMEEITIGRFPGADLVLSEDRNVSRLHAKIMQGGDKIKIIDLKSTNGVWVFEDNEWKKVDNSALVPSPSTIKIGDSVLAVRYDEQGAEPLGISNSLLVSIPETINNKNLEEAIMVLDLCQSSSIANIEGDEIAIHLKKRLFQICDSVFLKYLPEFRKSTGDGFYATFPQAEQCLNAAIKIMKTISARNKASSNMSIDIRIGMHFGNTYIVDSQTQDRHGNDLNIAFRIEGVTDEAFTQGSKFPLPAKDRLVASMQFVEHCRKYKPIFRSLGEANLKGIGHPVELLLFVL